MATSTLLQTLDSSANEMGISASARRQTETFLAGDAIAANDLVALDLTKSATADKALYIKKADGGAAEGLVVVGFALNTAAAGDTCEVTIAGVHQSANVATVALGDRLKVSPTIGQAGVYGAGDTVPVIGYALAVDVANIAPVFVIKQF